MNQKRIKMFKKKRLTKETKSINKKSLILTKKSIKNLSLSNISGDAQYFILEMKQAALNLIIRLKNLK